MAKKSNVIMDSDYRPRNKQEEMKTGKNNGGFVDITPKTSKRK